MHEENSDNTSSPTPVHVVYLSVSYKNHKGSSPQLVRFFSSISLALTAQMVERRSGIFLADRSHRLCCLALTQSLLTFSAGCTLWWESGRINSSTKRVNISAAGMAKGRYRCCFNDRPDAPMLSVHRRAHAPLRGRCRARRSRSRGPGLAAMQQQQIKVADLDPCLPIGCGETGASRGETWRRR